MTWTYVLTNLTQQGKDAVRFLIGDTDTSYQQLQDEEIAFALSFAGTMYGAAAISCQALAAKYARQVSISADGQSQQLAQKSVAYQRLAMEYADKVTIFNSAPYAGGISMSDMLSQLANADRVPDIFRLCMFDDPPTSGANPSLDQPGSNVSNGGPFPDDLDF